MKIPYSCPDIKKDDIRAMERVLKGRSITQGKQVNLFEKKISGIAKSKFSVVLNSATSALHLACKSLGVNKNTLVWLPTNTFVSTANAVLFCGGKIDLIDIDYNSRNISIQYLEKKLEKAKKKNKLPSVVIVVHFAGYPSNLKKINKLSKKYKFKILEDSSHALGAKIDQNPIGSCKFSDVSVFSFHAIKIITTGEGGAITTNNRKIFERSLKLRSHGIERNINKNKQWSYNQSSLGFNYRITDFQCILGSSQIKRLPSIIKKRNVIAKKYDKFFSQYPDINILKPLKGYISSYHLYVINLKKRDELYKFLKKNNIESNIHYIPIYKHGFYRKLYRFNQKNYPNTVRYFKSCLSIPLFTQMSESQQKKITSVIKKFLK